MMNTDRRTGRSIERRNVCRSGESAIYYSRSAASVRRIRVCQMQRRMILVCGAVLLLIGGVLLGSSIVGASRSNASNEDTLYKYYTSVEVQAGDTLWTIAEQYMQENDDRNDYIQELKEMNHLQSDTIHAGDYLTIAYYSHEFK